MGLSLLVCLGRHTLSGLLVTCGQQQQDWSAAYRLFSKGRVEVEKLFAPALEGAVALQPEGEAIVGAVDDSLLPKSGRKVPGSKWRRDPQGPRFRVNLKWAQRVVQTMLALPEGRGAVRARAVPVAQVPAPSVPPLPKGADPELRRAHRQQQREQGLAAVGAAQVRRLRERLDEVPGGGALALQVAVDGGYTNRTVFRQCPARTVLIGRLRKDAHLFAPPCVPTGKRGRRRIYGAPQPTPEAVRQDPQHPWEEVVVWAAGKQHTFRVKRLGLVRWRGTGARDVQVVIVAPLGYRLTRRGRLLYRKPAYLICTDPALPLAQVLQAYVWRGQIEVSFREEKTLLGMGEAQVRTEASAVRVPAFVAAMYAFLQVAAAQAAIRQPVLVRPKWQRPQPGERCSTAHLLSLLRAETWGEALGVNFRDFIAPPLPDTKPSKTMPAPAAAVIYAQG